MSNSDRSSTYIDCIIIGGGLTGLIAATLLQRQGHRVTVLDKGRGIGGRLATRRLTLGEKIEGVFDYGTQYFSVKDPRFQVWVDEWLHQKVIKVWSHGFEQPDGNPRYCGVKGTRGIAKYLAKHLAVHTSTRVIKINREDQWQITTADHQSYRSKALVMTLPVPQSLTLLDTSSLVLPENLRQSLLKIKYYSCLAILALLEKPSKIPTPGGITPEPESLVWLGDNHQKGISPHGYAVTIHASPEFSDTHWDDDDSEIAAQLFAAASEYLGSKIIKYQVHRWRYSLPQTFYSQACAKLPQFSLVLGGDAFVAAKLEGAVISGMAAAKFINQQL